MKEAKLKSSTKPETETDGKSRRGPKPVLSALRSGVEWTGDPNKDEIQFYQMKEKLKFYEKIEIKNLLEELQNKTYLIESFIQQKKDEEAQKSKLEKPSRVPKQKSVRKSPDLRWNIKYATKADSKTSAVSAEPSSRMEHELSRLTALNQQLIQLLENNSIQVPSDILSSDKNRVSFSFSNARPMSGADSTTTLPYVIPDISRASSVRKSRISRPASGHSVTVVGTPSIAGSQTRPSTARPVSRPVTSRPISGRLNRITGFD